MIKIRECQIDDYVSIYRINKECMGYDYPLDKTKEKIDQIVNSQKDKIYIAEINQQVVGYIHACDYDLIYMEPLKNIMGIAVDSKYQRMGIGRQLLEAIEKWAKETGAAGVRLVSGESRYEAHLFYQSCGYCFVKNQKNFIKRW